MRAVVIINPISGSGGRRDAGAARARQAASALSRLGVQAETRITAHAGHARELARQALAGSPDLVYAWGGDGTFNEVASVLAGSTLPVAVVPAGSGNGLARSLGLPLDPEAAIARGLTAATIAIDAGELAGRLFFNVGGVGFDARIAAIFNARAPGRRGLLAYMGIAARELWSFEPLTCSIDLGAERFRVRVLLVAIANAPQYGNGATIAPGADPCDGRLDVVIVEARSPVATLVEARRLFDGSLARAPGVVIRRSARVTLACDRPAPVHVDGEPAEAGAALEAAVRPRALLVKAGSDPTGGARVAGQDLGRRIA